MHTFLSVMSDMLTKFYKYKRFLMNLGVMNIPLAEFIFNLQHNREKYQEQIYPGKQLNEGMIASILSYIPYSSSYKAIGASKKFKEGDCFDVSDKASLNAQVLKSQSSLFHISSIEFSSGDWLTA